MIDNNNSANNSQAKSPNLVNTNTQNIKENKQEELFPNSNNTKGQEIFRILAKIKDNLVNGQIQSTICSYNIPETIKDALYYQLESLNYYIDLIEEINNYLVSSYNNIENESILMDMISMLENLLYLSLFHFDCHINRGGLKILNSLLNELDYDFHKDILQKNLKILFLLKMKKSVNNIVCSKLINNFSLALLVILNNTNDSTRKMFYDFVLSNSEDYILMWIICNSTSHDLNFSKFYTIENITILIEKSVKELDKQINLLETALQMMKDEKSIAVKSKIKQSSDSIGCIVKLIESFLIRESKTYNYDRVLKNCLIPAIKKFWNLVLFINDSFFYVRHYLIL
jgi:hypothetical protein